MALRVTPFIYSCSIIISSSFAVLLNHLKPQGLLSIPKSLPHPTAGVRGGWRVGARNGCWVLSVQLRLNPAVLLQLFFRAIHLVAPLGLKIFLSASS